MALLAIGQGAIFAIGTVVTFVVFTAALSLAYLRFDELGEDE